MKICNKSMKKVSSAFNIIHALLMIGDFSNLSNILSQEILVRSLNDSLIPLCRCNHPMTYYTLWNATHDYTSHINVLLLSFNL